MPEEDKSVTDKTQNKNDGGDKSEKDLDKSKDKSDHSQDRTDEDKGEKQYSESYVKSITQENARRRQKEKELEDQLKAYQDAEVAAETDLKKKNEALLKKAKELEQQLAEKATAADRRFIVSEARRVAKDLGMIDVDDVKAIDLADLRVSDDDTVIGLEDKIAELKKNKPHWFKPATDESDDGEDKNKGDKKDRSKKPVITPRRKGDASSEKDWSTATPEDLRKALAGYGVMS